MIRTIIAEDSTIAQNYFFDMLTKDGAFQVLGICSDAFEAEKLCDSDRVELVLMDVMTKNHHSGLAAGKRIREKCKGTKVVAVTSLIDGDVLAAAKAGGADSLWYKDYGTEDLLEVIHRTMEGERVFPDRAPDIRLGEMFSSDISPRQMQVLRRFVMGLTYDEIAAELNLSKRGVRWYMEEIMQKGGFKNRHEMLAAILQNQLIVTTLIDSEKE